MQFDNKVSLGNILTAATMLVVIISGYINLQSTQVNQAQSISALDRRGIDSDTRLRTLEVMMAGQESDLSNIRESLTDIKKVLEKLAERKVP